MNKLLILLLVFSLTGCQTQNVAKPKACDMDGCTSELSQTIEFPVITMDEALSYFTDNKTGILYFGFTDCPWCQQAAPILKEAANQTNQSITYVKVRDEDKNRLYTEEQRERIAQYISPYMEENEKGILTLYVPLVIVVKDGKAIDGHLGTLDAHDAKKTTLSDLQAEKLKQVYLNLLKQV